MTPTDLHLSEAREWIERNGAPETPAQMREMACYVVHRVEQKVCTMANDVFKALDAAREDEKHSMETPSGQAGRDFIDMILGMVQK